MNSNQGFIKKTLITLSKKWWDLLLVIFDPYVVILTSLIVYLYFLHNKQIDTNVIFVITLGISLVSGLVGGILAKRWDDLTETKIINMRGKSACRNLKLLLSRSIELEKRVIEYLNRITQNENNSNNTAELLETYFEEIIYECVNLDEIIINSIEDWKDLIPEESIQSIIEEIKNCKKRIFDNKKTLEHIQIEMQSIKETSEEKASLVEQARQIEVQSKSDYIHLSNLATSSGLNFTTGSLITGGTITENSDFDKSNIPHDFANYTYDPNPPIKPLNIPKLKGNPMRDDANNK